MTTIDRPHARRRHRAAVPAEHHPDYARLTPLRAQKILTAMVALCVTLLIIDAHPSADRVAILGATLALWAGHGWIITHRGGAGHDA